MTDITNANIPGAAPLVDANGQITMVWYQFLLALFNRTGGSGTPPDISGLQQQVDAQDVEINSFVPAPQRPAQPIEPSITIPPPSNAITFRPISNIFRSVESKLREEVSVRDFGAKGDGVTDDTAAFNAALASSATAIYVPAATYNIAGTIAFTVGNKKLIGDGEFLTILSSSSAALPVITVNANFIVIEGIGIGSSVTATSGGNGIVFLAISEYTRLSHIHVTKRFDGIVLSNADVANADTIICDLNQRHGILQVNDPSYGPCQWELTNILCGQNGGDGINVSSVVGPPGLILGSWNSIKTFANTGYGVSLNGRASCPIFDMRAVNMFLGSDGLGCINFVSFGGNHRISGMFERAGLDPTGPSGTTPAPHTSQNIIVGPSELDVTIYGSNIQTASENGVFIAGGTVVISGSSIVSNGVSGVVNQQNGVELIGGTLTMSGCNVTSNQHAVSTSLDNVLITGCNVTSTSTPLVGPFGSLSSITGCFPVTPTLYTPTFAPSAGAFGSASASGHYVVSGKIVNFQIAATITTVGTATGSVTVSLPFPTSSTGGAVAFAGEEVSLTGKTIQGSNVSPNTTTVIVRYYDTSSVIAAGATLVLSGSYVTN